MARLATFPVVLAGATLRPVTVRWATADGVPVDGIGAALAGQDYDAASGILLFQPADVAKAIVVKVRDDDPDKIVSRFSVKLTAGNGAVLSRSEGFVVIPGFSADGIGVLSIGASGIGRNP